MSENKTILTTRRFELWWRKVQAWFATQFASIKVDLTPVEEKIDEAKTEVLSAAIGSLVPATEEEYEIFKSQLSDKIANILTPITEE